MAILRFPNLAQTTLTGGGIAIGGPSFTVAAPAAFGASDFIVRVEDAAAGLPAGTTIEFMRVTAVAGSTFTVTKGLGGTADQAHPAGSFCTAVLTHEALTLGLVQQVVGATEIALSPAGGQGIVTLSVPDSSIKTRKITLENNITRVRSHQTGMGTTVITTAGTWYNCGAAVTITPAVASLIMVWGSVSGSGNVNSTLYGRLQFGGANGDSGGLGTASRDDALGLRSVPFFDTYLQPGQGALSIQCQLTADNNADTFTPAASGGYRAQLDLLILAIPST